jgi:mannose-6-phosphate isomerase-like protein (cupin superfamily)
MTEDIIAKINLTDKLAKFADTWAPRVIAELNDYQLKVVKIQGEFVWHTHENTDELFLVVQGTMSIEFKTYTVDLEAGELLIVPKGTPHKPMATHECQVLLIEPRGVVNTGDHSGELTAENDRWV